MLNFSQSNGIFNTFMSWIYQEFINIPSTKIFTVKFPFYSPFMGILLSHFCVFYWSKIMFEICREISILSSIIFCCEIPMLSLWIVIFHVFFVSLLKFVRKMYVVKYVMLQSLKKFEFLKLSFKNCFAWTASELFKSVKTYLEVK